MVISIVIVILVAVLALPLVIFLLLAAAVFFGSRDAEKTNKKTIGMLSVLACPTCGQIYGVEAAELAQQEHIDACQAASKANPGLILNFVRFWVVRCPNCQITARFYYQTESLDS
jgi:hypothetical protein